MGLVNVEIVIEEFKTSNHIATSPSPPFGAVASL